MCDRVGGGAALLHLSEFVPEFADTLTDPEEKLGADIVRKALLCPARLIANNAGYEGDVIVESLLGQPFEQGYNAVRSQRELRHFEQHTVNRWLRSEHVVEPKWRLSIPDCDVQMENRIENLIEAGILDPAKVTRNALLNAGGIAGILLTTQAIIVEKSDPKKPKTPIPGGYGPGGMPAGMTM